jgi:hypothetical protein
MQDCGLLHMEAAISVGVVSQLRSPTRSVIVSQGGRSSERHGLSGCTLDPVALAPV